MKKNLRNLILIIGLLFPMKESSGQEISIQIDLSNIDSTNIDSIFRAVQMEFLNYQKMNVFDDFSNELKWSNARLKAIEEKKKQMKEGGEK